MSMRKMNWKYCYLLIITALLVSCSQPSVSEEESLFTKENTDVELESVELSAQEEELFDLINTHRNSKGLEPVMFIEDIYVFAEEHNEYMIAQGELSHDNFNTRASQISEQTAAKLIAENVAKNFQDPNEALEGWLASNSHKNTIEGDFTHSTLSISYDNEGNPYYTQIFIRK